MLGGVFVATSAEIRHELKQRLFMLLELKEELKDTKVRKLDSLIGLTMASMEQDDIRHVEEKFTQVPK